MNTIQVPRSLVNQLLHHAQSSDTGACGVIVKQHDGRLTSAVLPNPLTVEQLQTWLAAQSAALWGVYQTQILPQALPTDLQQLLFSKQAFYFLVQLNLKGVLELCVFRELNKTFVQGMLELCE